MTKDGYKLSDFDLTWKVDGPLHFTICGDNGIFYLVDLMVGLTTSYEKLLTHVAHTIAMSVTHHFWYPILHANSRLTIRERVSLRRALYSFLNLQNLYFYFFPEMKLDRPKGTEYIMYSEEVEALFEAMIKVTEEILHNAKKVTENDYNEAYKRYKAIPCLQVENIIKQNRLDRKYADLLEPIILENHDNYKILLDELTEIKEENNA